MKVSYVETRTDTIEIVIMVCIGKQLCCVKSLKPNYYRVHGEKASDKAIPAYCRLPANQFNQ